MKPRSKVWFHLRGQKDLALILSANTVLDPVSILGILFRLLKFSRILTKFWVSDVCILRKITLRAETVDILTKIIKHVEIDYLNDNVCTA